MSAFAFAVDALFMDPNMSVDAVYYPGGEAPGHPVRVMTRAPDRIASFGEGRFVAEAILIDVRTSEVAHLQRGDTFEIGERLLEIRSDPVRDTERLTWAAEARDLG